MTETLHEAMHADHRYWAGDLAMWQDDLVAWQHELARVFDDLDKAKKSLEEHGKVIEGHALQIRKQLEKLKEHEKTLANFERGEAPSEVVRLAASHDEQSKWHPHLRNVHERIKKYHHTVAARASLLSKALAEPM